MTLTLTLLCGMPAAGKSTYASRCHGAATVLTADAIRDGSDPARVFGRMFRQATAELSAGRSVVIDVCALRSTERASWLGIARRQSAHAALIVIDTPMAECMERAAARRDKAALRHDWLALNSLMQSTLRSVRREGWNDVRVITSRSPQSRF